ncbi:integrase [Hansschlegelia plantiphila]|uniref:Integrase n=2 Tax=Hansschlegelia plantiphila TaxID=374655 RepID=A0A9W6J200_9HYPH|nr:integrase [Hansschlegelia plantiphila]
MAKPFLRGKTYWARAQRNGRTFRRSLRTSDFAIAKDRMRQWLKQLDAEAWGDRAKYTFEEASEKFIAEHYPSLKPASRKRYGISLVHLNLHIGPKDITEIGSAEMSAFETARRSAGASAPTIRRDLACLSSVMTSCEDWEWLDDGKNPVPAFLKRRARRGLKESPPNRRYLTEDEEIALLKAATPMVRAAMAIAIDTGLRREELFSLRWSQVDIARGMITTTTKTKNGRARVVPLPSRSAQFMLQRPQHIRSEFVIRHDNGDRVLQMNRGLKGAIRRANIPDLSWHDLRRTAGCRWLQRDRRSMEEVSLLLGHSSIKVTESVYAFLDEEEAATRTFPATGTAD